MLPYFDDISAAYIDHRTPDALCGVDDDVVVLGHVKCVQSLDFLPRPVQYTLINRIWHAVIYELRQHQAVFAVVEHLKGVGGERQPVSDVWISSQHRIDVSCEFRPLILIDCVCDIGRRTLDLYPSPNTALRLVSQRMRWSAAFCSAAQTPDPATWYVVLCGRCLLAADLGYELEHRTSQLIILTIMFLCVLRVNSRLDVHRHSHPALPSLSCRVPPL